ncbi:GtrA family protein [Xanthomonas hortorum pv. pelargonii]|uniref:GtrA family protein n=1 Tax=Xanthomonas hortorum pv. pelargonii TaxID=453602 RepID=A0AAW9ZKZ7_9XANT|nr:GtrA family protein [Xanthomonas hortorum pv. pelargonii]
MDLIDRRGIDHGRHPATRAGRGGRICGARATERQQSPPIHKGPTAQRRPRARERAVIPQRHRALAARFLRFCIVGGASTVAFSALTWLAVSKLGMQPTMATALCYLVLVPINFVAHRSFTFVSSGHLSSEGLRFILLHSFNLALSIIGMGVAVNSLHLHYAWGIAFSAVVVPVVVFLVMNFWVFNRDRRRDHV